jgi:hypothetical protein
LDQGLGGRRGGSTDQSGECKSSKVFICEWKEQKMILDRTQKMHGMYRKNSSDVSEYFSYLRNVSPALISSKLALNSAGEKR